MGQTWDWQVFLRDDGGGRTYLEWLLSAWGWTLSVSVLALIVALLIGSLMGILRTTPSKALVFSATPGPSCFATSRCWCRCSSGTT